MFRPTLLVIALSLSAPTFAQAGIQVKTVAKAQIIAKADADFAKVDANKDGQMSRDEIENFQRATITRLATARFSAMFTNLDTDKNGQLSAAEFAKIAPPPQVDASSVLRIDTNKDGQVSLAEHRAAMLETFNKLDGNKDGILTAQEVKAATSILKK